MKKRHTPYTCRIPVIYILPKVHKNKENPTGSPIVNGIDSVGARLGEYLDFFLQPVVRETKVYLKYTKHLIQILEEITFEE